MRSDSPSPIFCSSRLWLAPVALVVVLGASTGCTGGKLALRSAGQTSGLLAGNFNFSVYGYDDHNSLHVLLIEGRPEQPTQAVHVQMYWTPRAGRTPIDPQATNTLVRYIVFTPDGAGVYGGAGYLFPQNTPGQSTFQGQLRHSALRLQDASVDFTDRLGLATATGEFRARRDDLGTQRLLRQLQVVLHERLGYPRLVTID